MSSTYLPADVRTRIIDLMKEHKFSQKKLALSIGVHESTIGRFLNGTTEKLSEESVIRIAKTFNVSTDFILGTTEIPDKKNYDISELGLSVEAARNLYTGKVKADIVNRLLENPRFATVTYMIAGYLTIWKEAKPWPLAMATMILKCWKWWASVLLWKTHPYS